MPVKLTLHINLGDYNMNRVDFMDQVKNWLGNATDEQKDLFILDQASKTSPDEREAFLENLKHPAKVEEQTAFDQQRYNQIIRDLREIEEMDLCVYGEFDPDADYWDDDPYYYEDSDGIGRRIDNAIDFFYELADDAFEDRAISLGEEILKTPVNYDTEDGGLYEASFDNLCDDDLLHHQPEQFLRDYLSLILTTAHAGEQSIRLAKAMIGLSGYRGHIPGLLPFLENHRNQVGDRDDFLISFFGEVFSSGSDLSQSNLSGKLWDLLYLIEDHDLLMEETRIFAEYDPNSLSNIFQILKQRLTPEEFMAFADEMLGKMQPSDRRRSGIADDAYYAARGLNDAKKQEKYLLEGFRSEPTLERFLGLVARTEDFIPKNPDFISYMNEIRSRTQRRREAFPFQRWSEKQGCFTLQDEKRVRFLLGDRKDWIQELIKPEQIWDLDTLHFFLTVLCSPNRVEDQYNLFRTTTTDGLGIYVREPYCYGKDVSNALSRLLTEIPLTDKESELLLGPTMSRMNSRVMKGLRTQERKTYPEIANEIYAAGKLLEDHGEKNASVLLMHYYQRQFLRHRAFENALKAYGFSRQQPVGEVLELPLFNRLLKNEDEMQLRIQPDR